MNFSSNNNSNSNNSSSSKKTNYNNNSRITQQRLFSILFFLLLLPSISLSFLIPINSASTSSAATTTATKDYNKNNIMFMKHIVRRHFQQYQQQHHQHWRKISSSSSSPFAVLLHATTTSSSSSSDSVPSTSLPTNQDLVARRLEISRQKKEARYQSQQQRYQNNLKLKNLIYSNHNQQNNISSEITTRSSTTSTNNNYTNIDLYAIKVSVCEELREELRLSGKEKRGRVFVQVDDNITTQTLKGLNFKLHSFFRALKKSTFLLQACLPTIIDEDGTVESSHNIWGQSPESWNIQNDQDVVNAFQAADKFFQDHPHSLKRPSFLLHVYKDPNAPPPPPPPQYLQQMQDPALTKSMTMLSFYAFPPDGIPDAEQFALQLRKKWKPFNALGRVYVAKEGINAQMSVPTNVLDNFIQCCKSIQAIGNWMENGINIDPIPITMEEFPTAGVPLNGIPAPPFKNLHIRVRNQIVADGLDKELDWQSAGYDMPPIEWHQKLRQAQNNSTEDGAPILLDCRNTYETDIGKFDGAEPLSTEAFRDSWDILKDRLADTPKDAPIMTYCTGGIRCVKVGAYLTQELGFTNVSRLAGGIIAYDRTIQEQAPNEESMFKGTNFVFDGRLGREITDDEFGTCITCGKETSSVSNCLNDNCHKRMVQCESCRTSFHGTCSDACRQRVVSGGMLLSTKQQLAASSKLETSHDKGVQYKNLDDYSVGHSSPTPSIYAEMEFNAQAFMPSGAHMVSGASQGRLLKQLASMTREGRILELGTFTGYATACFLEGAAAVHDVINNGDVGSRKAGPYVMSLERDSRAIDIAAAHMKILEEHGIGQDAAEAACALRAEGKEQLPTIEDEICGTVLENKALCEIVRVGDALATIEEMGRGEGKLQPAPFDLVFVDADKTRLVEYAEALLSSDRILKKGGLIVVDNVLWKGLVLEASSGEFSSMTSSSEDENDGSNIENDSTMMVKKNRRARKLATKMHKFNSEIVKDDRVEVVVLPMRDGLSVIRKK